jgi:hypothetical protein
MVDCCVLAAGMPNGMIARREFSTLPPGRVYPLNEKAWFNNQIMLNVGPQDGFDRQFHQSPWHAV